MDMVTLILLLIMAAVLLLQILLLVRGQGQNTQLPTQLLALQQAQEHGNDRLSRELREEIGTASRLNRGESNATLSQFQQALMAQLTSVATLQNNQIDSFSQQLAKLTESNVQQLEAVRQNLLLQAQQMREEQRAALRQFSEALGQQLLTLTESNTQRLLEVRSTLEQRLKEIEASNTSKLEEMRRTVDEKLHATLEQRLGESFKQVSDRLEQVHRGLGEMQNLAQGVGDLKKVLSNVKTRGTWGEVQLEMLLEQLLTPDQYAKNTETVRGSNARVEFAIKLPGKGTRSGEPGEPVWLPIDAKFPREQYERLVEAQELADSEAAAAAGKELEAAIKREAQTIAEKYLSPPATTDFALLFLPTEGLYAEVLRRPGLSDQLQRQWRVTIAGPTTLTALLNSLQMGFRTLALEKRSSEVWEVLGAVKTEFGKFGEVLAGVKKNLEAASNKIGMAETRAKQMGRKLRSVEALPGDVAMQLLELPTIETDE